MAPPYLVNSLEGNMAPPYLGEAKSNSPEGNMAPPCAPDAPTVTTQPTQCSELEQYKKRFELLDRVAHAQAMHLRGESKPAVFNTLLDGLLKLMNSEYGFIGGVQYEEDGSPYMLAHAFTNVAWTTASKRFCESCIPTGLKFSNMNTLFGRVITQKQPVISNHPASDPRAVGTPPGHPEVKAFLGIPFRGGEGEILGLVAIANKPGGYSEADLHYLEPFCVTCSSLIQSYRQQEENQRLINTLEQSVQERTKKLQKTNQELQAANRKVTRASKAQLEHFACMSHEIRTPLNCIIGLSSLLLETPLNPGQEEALRMIVSSGDLLLTVVNDVLDFSRLETGNVDIDIRKENLQDTLNTVLRSIETKASEKNISLVMECDTSVPKYMDTDGRRLQQILYNLLGNAVKFSKEDTQVELRISTIHKADPEALNPVEIECPRNTGPGASAESKRIQDIRDREIPDACPSSLKAFITSQKKIQVETDNTPANEVTRPFPAIATAPLKPHIRFEVVDYGKGIREEDFRRIFQPFIQADEESEFFYGGSGLGLAITKKLVSRLGGQISVASEVGSFTKFTVDLPGSKEYAVTPSPLREELKKVSILLIGADESTIAYLRASSEVFGYTLQVLDDLSQCQPALVKDRGVFERFLVLVDETLLEKCPSTEDLVDDSIVLLSMGPKFSDSHNAAGHYRSVSKIIPAVLAESFANHIKRKYDAKQEISRAQQCDAEKYVNLQVLVAEDNLVNQKVLIRLLRRLGVTKITVVDNGQKAVDRCANQKFDVVLLDYQMPICNGIDACRLILQSASPVPKIAFVTAQASPTFVRECEEAGSSFFMAKPFNYRDLERLLCTITGR